MTRSYQIGRYPAQALTGKAAVNEVVPFSGKPPAGSNVLAPVNLSRTTLDLTVATTDQIIDVFGNYLHAAYASNPTALIQVRFEPGGTQYPVQAGTLLYPFEFNKLYVSWDAQAGVDIVLLTTRQQLNTPVDVE